MKCCASQTTFTGVKDEREVVSDRVNALLFAQVLKPLAKSLGPFGDGAIDAIVEKLFLRDVR